MKIAVIKADDIKGITEKWSRFFELSREKGVKVSVGVICNSLSDNDAAYFEWLRKNEASGWVEFWNHGWDHKRWENEAGEKIYEFQGSGYEHQKKHFEDSQVIMRHVLGKAPVAFGTPYNKADDDTKRVMKENSDVGFFFGYRDIKLGGVEMARMRFKGEHDGTGKPNFDKFVAEYREKGAVTFSAIQFHPNKFTEEHFVEYEKIIDFLKMEGWVFMLPTEYLDYLNSGN